MKPGKNLNISRKIARMILEMQLSRLQEQSSRKGNETKAVDNFITPMST
jgi:hypothetical protein